MFRLRHRFFAWYRTVPLVLVAIVALLSGIYVHAPAFCFKPVFQLKYEKQILESSKRHGIDPYLVAAIIKCESNWNSSAASNKGAQGLMQLMPETASDMISKNLVDGSSYDVSDLSDPATNIEFGCAYLSYLLKYFNGSIERSIAAYNAGMGNVDNWSKQRTTLRNAITFPETQAYLARVNNAYARYMELYPSRFE